MLGFTVVDYKPIFPKSNLHLEQYHFVLFCVFPLYELRLVSESNSLRTKHEIGEEGEWNLNTK